MATASATLGSTATVAIFSMAGLVALSELGINLGPMLAGAGIAGIAIGFGAQNLVRDVLAGLFVILEDQYGVGDTIDAGKASGTVEELSLRVTKLRDVEGTLWFIPNGTISEVGNKTQLWARAILDVTVAYDADHRRAGDVIKATADRIWREQRPGERIIEEPELWGVERLSDVGVVIRLAVKSAPAEQWKVARTLRSEIKEALDGEGLEIPVPMWTRSVRSHGQP
jgi:small conductance mechanosensitive channel